MDKSQYILASAESAFDQLLQSEEHWILSVVESGKFGLNKTDFITALIKTRCKNVPYSSYSLDFYVDDIGSLLSAILESPSIQKLVPPDTYTTYQRETASALADAVKNPMTLARNEITATATDSEQTQTIDFKADSNQIVKSLELISVRFSDRRIAYLWLNTISRLKLRKEPPFPSVVFFFDEFDVFEDNVDPQDYVFFWGIIDRVRKNRLIPGLKIVLASHKGLKLISFLRSPNTTKFVSL